jgi:iron complex outermembrane receptor protein
MASPASAQHVLRVVVTDEHEGGPLPGASVIVEGTEIGAATDADGRAVVTGVPSGEQTVVVSFVGFEAARLALTFPLADPETPIQVALEEGHEHGEEIVVGATRTGRTIAAVPTRVETIAGEEIDEKISMEPSNITMLLNESPGIVVQQTSAVTGDASIRIQGLDGRYTQLLKDGFPLFGGFAGGLSLLQIPPLDLRQVEIIKGPASTLYGGDAIAGLVNLVSKTPGESAESPAERSLLVNATSAGGYDVGGFFADRSRRVGYTVLASGNLQRAYDGDDDGYTNLPQTYRATLAPRLFFYPTERTTAWVGLTGTWEDREGGDYAPFAGGTLPAIDYFSERSVSRRLTSQARLDHAPSERVTLTLKQSTSRFERDTDVVRFLEPRARTEGVQTSTYTEASGLFRLGPHDLVVGADLRTENADIASRGSFQDTEFTRDRLSFDQRSAGLFVQDTWDATDRLAFEAGLRGEHHDRYGYFALPRASALYRISDALSARLTGGFGYRAPTVLDYGVQTTFASAPIGGIGVATGSLAGGVDAETSRGGTFDVNLQTVLFDRLSVSLNQAVYLTRLDGAIVYMRTPPHTGFAGRFVNAEAPVLTRGLETNARFGLGDLKLFLGYVYLDASEGVNGRDDRRRDLLLTPEHKTYSVLVWERHGRGRVGLEAYYTGPQRLASGERTPGYWVTGVMGEWRFGPARLFLNFENFLDTQQADYGPVVTFPGSPNVPQFAEIWAPTDGFIVNGGIKYDF